MSPTLLPWPSPLLIAGGGFIGATLGARAREGGSHVHLWVKTEATAAARRATAINLQDRHAVLRAATAIGPVRAIVACASTRGGDEETYRQLYVEGTRNLLDAFPGTRLIFTSSTSVFGQTDGSIVTEADPPTPATATARRLVEAEQLVLNRGGTVLRLGGLYGAGRWVTRERFLQGSALIEGDGNDFLNLLHRDDAVAALELLVKSPEISGTYHATDGHPTTRLEHYAALAGYYGKPPPPLVPPRGEKRRGRTNKRVTSERLTALGWSPTFPHISAALKSGE